MNLDEIRKKKLAEEASVIDGGMDAQSAAYIGDLAAAAGPALLSTLFGGSAKTNSELFDKGNQYLMNRGRQEEITKDKLSVIEDDNGDPLNILSRDAVGKKPYYQAKLAKLNGGSSGKWMKSTHEINGKVRDTLYNNATGEVVDFFTKEPLLEGEAWKTPQYKSSRGLGGGYNVTKINPVSGKMVETQLDPGLGDKLGTSNDEAKSAVKMAEKARTETLKPQKELETAQFSLDTLRRPNITPEAGAAAIHGIVKAVNGERMSDNDYAQLRGSEFKSYVRMAEDWADGKISGRLPQHVIDAYIEVAQHVISQKRKQISQVKNTLVPSNLLPAKGQKIIDNSAGKIAPNSGNWKNNLKGIR